MVPIRITLKNFLSYRGSVGVEFAGLGLACLSGENGAGKSALLDAMTWAIWGQSRARTDVELISLGETEAEVTFEFRMGAREYRVMRRRTRSRHTLEFDSRQPGAENWLPIGGDSIRDTQARIITELNLDYETFANSAFLRQGEADLFTQNRPSERKRILSDILALSGYDRLVEVARAELRTRRGRLDVIQSRLGQIDLQLANRHQFEVEQAELDDEVTAANARVAELRVTVDALRDRIAAAELSEAHLERTNARIHRLEEQTAQTKRESAKLEEERLALEASLATEAEVNARLQDVQRWKAQADEFAAALTARQPIQQRIQEIERALAAKKSELEQQHALAAQSASALQARLDEVQTLLADAEPLRASYDEQRKQLERLPQIEERQAELQSSIMALTETNAGLRSRMDDIMGRIDSLSTGDAICPVCRKPIGAGEHEHIHDEWRAEGKQLGDTFRENRKLIGAQEDEAQAAQRELSELRALSRTVAGLEARIKQVELQASGQGQLASELEAAQRAASELAAALADDSYFPDKRRELDQLYTRLSDIPYDERAHRDARERSAEFEAVQQEHRQLQQARDGVAARTEQLAALDSRLGDIATELVEQRQDADEIARGLEGIDEARGHHKQFTDELTKLSTDLGEKEQRRGIVRRRLEELDELADEHKTLRSESRTLSSEADAYSELVNAFGRNGIQAMVIENVIPELQDEANRILDRMTTKQLEVEFRTMRAAVSSDSTIETLDIIIKDESGRRDYQLFSGGEAFRIDFAIRVALSRLLARRAGASVDTLIIDEGFGSQDQHGRDGLIEALQSVTSDFELILVITHVDELRYQFPNRIEIVKTAEGSRATLV